MCVCVCVCVSTFVTPLFILLYFVFRGTMRSGPVVSEELCVFSGFIFPVNSDDRCLQASHVGSLFLVSTCDRVLIVIRETNSDSVADSQRVLTGTETRRRRGGDEEEDASGSRFISVQEEPARHRRSRKRRLTDSRPHEGSHSVYR